METEDLFLDDPDLQIREGETAKSYRAFMDYCNMGAGRSLAKMVQVYQQQNVGNSSASRPPTLRLRTLEDWSSQFSWKARLRVYENLRARAERKAELTNIKEMNTRHVNFALTMLNLAATQLQAFSLDRNLALTVGEVRNLIVEAVRIEREARGAHAVDLANTMQDADAAARGAGGRFRVIEVVKDYGNPNPIASDDSDEPDDD